jgi:hypothetical protein
MLKQVLPNGRPEDNINIGREGVGWINLAQDREK